MPSLDALYAKLKVARNADDGDIKRSYRRLVLKYHPDKNPEDRDGAGQQLLAINEAYAILGNPRKRVAHEESSALAQLLARSPLHGDFATSAHRKCDVNLPNEFLLQPLASFDRFLRVVDRTLAFHARDDAKSAGFEDFFAPTKFQFYWLPQANNPTGIPKFWGQCRVSTVPSVGRDGKAVGTPGCLSFGLSEGVSSSEVMLTTQCIPMYCDFVLVPSPVYSRAFRFESAYFAGRFLAFDPPANALMTDQIDQFTIIDFLLQPYGVSWQFQHLDEVLVPCVVRLGSNKKHVKLTDICQDPNVRTWFQMAKSTWAFEDFAAYFNAHDDTWEYKGDKGKESVRYLKALPKEPEAPLAADVAKVETPSNKEAGDVSSEEPAGKKAKLALPSRPPTKVLVLSNLVGAGEVDEDLEEETSEEASKFGKVTKCIVKEISGVPDEEAVRIFLEFESWASSIKAYEAFAGRFFGGRTVKAWFYDEESFNKGELEKQDVSD